MTVTIAPHRWYEIETPAGRSLARVLTLDEAAGTTTLTLTRRDGRWARLAQPCRNFPLSDWCPSIVAAKPPEFEPPAVVVGLGGLLVRPMPAGDMAARVRWLGDNHAGFAAEAATLARHIEKRPVFVAEECAALTGAVLGWMLLGTGPVHEVDARGHEWVDLTVDVSTGAGSRRCAVCGLRDGLMGMAPRYCLGRDKTPPGAAGGA